MHALLGVRLFRQTQWILLAICGSNFRCNPCSMCSYKLMLQVFVNNLEFSIITGGELCHISVVNDRRVYTCMSTSPSDIKQHGLGGKGSSRWLSPAAMAAKKDRRRLERRSKQSKMNQIVVSTGQYVGRQTNLLINLTANV